MGAGRRGEGGWGVGEWEDRRSSPPRGPGARGRRSCCASPLRETRAVEGEAACREGVDTALVYYPSGSFTEGKEEKGPFVLFRILGELQGVSGVRRQRPAARQHGGGGLEGEGAGTGASAPVPIAVPAGRGRSLHGPRGFLAFDLGHFCWTACVFVSKAVPR